MKFWIIKLRENRRKIAQIHNTETRFDFYVKYQIWNIPEVRKSLQDIVFTNDTMIQ